MTISKKYLIGIDVGGTNTDSVLLDPIEVSSSSTASVDTAAAAAADSNEESSVKGILSWHKSVTTPDVSDGIQLAITKLFENQPANLKDQIISVTIGTTHFINAVIEQDRARLDKIAVLRLCSAYSRKAPPFCEFPPGLAQIVDGYTGFCTGGHQVDGQEINELDPQEIREHCSKIKNLGIKTVAVIGIFANMNAEQEKQAAEIIEQEIPGCDVVLSHTIAGIGFLERENATILNAAIKNFARKIITSFNLAVKRLGLNCPVLLTQNDGTVLTTAEAIEQPIRTFSSGATNSMRGAAFLCSTHPQIANHNVLVCDVGGTTTDVGMLLKTGFPRQSSSYSTIGGVRMNFSMPHVLSIGLGGGSIVRQKNDSIVGAGAGEITIGPDSVGAEIITKSIVFGGDVTTTTDVTMAMDRDILQIGKVERVKGKFDTNYQEKFTIALKRNLENVLDRMKTSPDPIAVILVGGGSFIAPTELSGASVVLRPAYYQVANAIGSALPKMSHTVLKMKSIDSTAQRDEYAADLLQEAKAALIAKGALANSIEVVTFFNEPIPYVDKFYKFEIKVVGEFDYNNMKDDGTTAVTTTSVNGYENGHPDLNVVNEIHKNSAVKENNKFDDTHAPEFDHESYRPLVTKDREWILSETDLEYIVIGAYILGCGGGGDPHGSEIVLRNALRRGEKVRIVTIEDVAKYCAEPGNETILNVGYCGSPMISGEKLHGPELKEAVDLMVRWLGKPADAVFPFEIGGDNGLQGMIAGASGNLNLPCVDADLMGRAMPCIYQTLPSVFSPNVRAFSTTTCCDGNGNSMVLASTKNDYITETIQRDAFNYHGVQFGFADPPLTVEQMKEQTIHNVHSLSWRIGRAVKIARAKSDIERLPERIVESCGGSTTAKCLFKGKIVKIDKRIERGYTYGECFFENTEEAGTFYKMYFKNENVVCYKADNIEMENQEVICSVPDLFTVIDADTGEAIGTQDYRYGIHCFVIAISPSPQWITPQGMKFGGPASFGSLFENIEHKPIGKYIKPVSIIDEFVPKE